MDSHIYAIIVDGRGVLVVINRQILKWFASRGISQKTVEAGGIYSGRHQQNGDSFEVVPDPLGNIIVFPYKRRGSVYNEKYRAAGKKFYQRTGGRKLFWNADILDDQALHEGRAALIITEGEIDALSVIEAGNPFVVSVPDGAPPSRDGELSEEVDPEFDTKYAYVFNDWDALKKAKRIIIAVDDDAPGKRLAEELVRRLGRARCSFVEFPEGCKDFNDVLLQNGAASVSEIIARARPYPVSGVYSYSELPDEPPLEPLSTGFGRLDDYFKPFFPSLVVVTGFAGSGKSSLINQIAGQLNILHGLRIGIASFEMRIEPFITEVLLQTYRESRGDPSIQTEWLDENFVFIAPEPSEEDKTFDIDWLIEKATVAVIRHGIRVLVIDPWNEIEHASRKGESQTDYTGRAIRALKRFGREFEVMVIVVAHPTKGAANKAPNEVTLYDISDCYSSDTDVLTKRGWIPFPEIVEADEVSCFDLKTEGLCWHQPSRIIRQKYHGRMIHFEGRSIDLLVTPNHKMVVKPNWLEPIGEDSGIGRPVRWPKGQWQFSLPDDLPKAPFLVPVAPGLQAGDDLEFIPVGGVAYEANDFVDFIGWYLAEGHETGVSIALSQGKEPYVAEIRDLLVRLKIDFKEGVSSEVGVHPLATMNTISYGIRKKSCPEFVEWIRDNCGKRSDGKRIPEMIYGLSPRLKRRLVEAFIRGDGFFYRNLKRREAQATAVTTSPFLRDGLQRLAVECGISCTSGPKVQHKDHYKPSWQLTFTFGRKEIGLDRRNGHLIVEIYDGDIYCLTVPTGAFMVRRNGRPVVSGNSAHFANKADFGLVVARRGQSEFDFVSNIYVKKVRYQPISGRPGSIELTYDPQTRVFSQ